MSWDEFINSVKSERDFATAPTQPSRYGSMPDLYFAAILPNSNANEINSSACFTSIGVSDLAGSLMFIEEPNVIVIDWDKTVLNTIQVRMEEWTEVLESENYDPQRLLHNNRFLENEFTFPYDFEFWERMNMALVEYYRKNKDPRLDELHHELKVAFELYTNLYEKIRIINRGSKYLVNEFNRESMRENSIENKRLVLGERYFKLNCKIFFKHVDAAILRRFNTKRLCYLNINVLDETYVDKLVKDLQQAQLKINRINFTDMLDDIVIAPQNLQIFMKSLKKFELVFLKNSNLIFNHINNFSLALPLDKTMLKLMQVSNEISNLKEEANSSIPALEQYAANYLASFKDICSYYVDKASFYD